MSTGYILTIAGCPYAFATEGADLTQVFEDNDQFPSGITVDRIIRGALKTPVGNWTEKLNLLGGDCDVGGLTFTILPIKMLLGGSECYLGDWLFSRQDQDRTQLSTSLSRDETVSFDIQSPTDVFSPSTNFVCWIGQEAIWCSEVAFGTVGILERGYYGSDVEDHNVDAANNFYPQVWGAYPGAQKKRVTLWRVDGSLADSQTNWTSVWQGYVNQAPKFNRDGLSWDLQCDALWSVYKQRSFAIAPGHTNLTGFMDQWCSVLHTWDAAVGTSVRFIPATSVIETDVVTPVGTEIRETFGRAYHRLYTLMQGTPWNATYSDIQTFAPWVTDGKLIMDSYVAGTSNFKAGLKLGTKIDIQSISGGRAKPTMDLVTAVGLVDCGIDTIYLHVDRLDRLPTTWTNEAINSTDTYIKDVLVADFDDRKARVTFTPSASLDSSPVKKIRGTARISPLNASDPGPYDNRLVFYYDRKEFQYKQQIVSAHWLDAFKWSNWWYNRGDYQRWTFDIPALKRVIGAGSYNSVEWLADSNTKLTDNLIKYCKFWGVCPAPTSGGFMSLVAIKRPGLLDTIAATITSADMVENPVFEYPVDALVQQVKITSDMFESLTINNPETNGEYSFGPAVEIDITGFSREAQIGGNIEFLEQHVVNRFFALYSSNYMVVTVKVPWTRFRSVSLGDTVSLTSWLLPDGYGGRGVTARKGIVIERTPDLGKNTVAFGLLLYPSNGGTGYSPCLRASAINAGVGTMTVDTNYLNTDSSEPIIFDYAGSNITAANDGGLSFVAAGDRVNLILRNSTQFVTQSLTVDTIDTTTRKITFTTLVNTGSVDWSAQALSGNVDLIYSDYGTVKAGANATTQATYAWVGSQGTGRIGTSTDRAQRFAP